MESYVQLDLKMNFGSTDEEVKLSIIDYATYFRPLIAEMLKEQAQTTNILAPTSIVNLMARMANELSSKCPELLKIQPAVFYAIVLTCGTQYANEQIALAQKSNP